MSRGTSRIVLRDGQWVFEWAQPTPLITLTVPPLVVYAMRVELSDEEQRRLAVPLVTRLLAPNQEPTQDVNGHQIDGP